MTKSQSTRTFAAIGIDVGKEVFHIVGFDVAGKIALRKKIRRSAFVREFERLSPSVVGLEPSPAHQLRPPSIAAADNAAPASAGCRR